MKARACVLFNVSPVAHHGREMFNTGVTGLTRACVWEDSNRKLNKQGTRAFKGSHTAVGFVKILLKTLFSLFLSEIPTNNNNFFFKREVNNQMKINRQKLKIVKGKTPILCSDTN